MRTPVKLSDLSTRMKKPLDWTINFVQQNFPDSITFVEDSTVKGGGIYLVDDREFNIICNAILTSDAVERGLLREQREINEQLAEDSLSEDEEDTVQTVSEYSRSNEVLLLADAAEALGISKESFTLAVRRAQANGVQLPAITIINSGNRGRPKYGYSNDFVDIIKKFIELPKTSSLFGVNAAYEPVAIGKSQYKTLVSNEFASKRLLGKFDENLQTLLDMLTGANDYGVSKDELANKLDISPKMLSGMLTDLQNRGYNLSVTGESAALETNFTADYTSRSSVEWGSNGTYKIGLVSDLHACCEYTKIKSIQSAYEQFEKQGVSIVFNAGDTTHGHVDMHGSYKYEIKLRNLENQLNHLVTDYPKIDGIQTFMIAGNHDLSWGRQGVDFIKLLSDRREDITYLGPTVAFVDGPDGIPNFVMLYHPKDGSGYALSYKTQKIAEYVTYALKGLTDDPDIPNIMPQIATIGHYHKYVHHKGPDGAHYITCPAMCGMTDFQKGKHLINEMGALMFEFGLNDKGKIDFWSIKGFDVGVGREVLYVEENYSSPRVSISGFWNKDTSGGKI